MDATHDVCTICDQRGHWKCDGSAHGVHAAHAANRSQPRGTIFRACRSGASESPKSESSVTPNQAADREPADDVRTHGVLVVTVLRGRGMETLDPDSFSDVGTDMTLIYASAIAVVVYIAIGVLFYRFVEEHCEDSSESGTPSCDSWTVVRSVAHKLAMKHCRSDWNLQGYLQQDCSVSLLPCLRRWTRCTSL
eukprot:SAG31_NODE_6963_length_1833_cov_1.531719_3_plen_193_part_00